jgi:hypothetical protein
MQPACESVDVHIMNFLTAHVLSLARMRVATMPRTIRGCSRITGARLVIAWPFSWPRFESNANR